jgi:hypothetical protein
MTKDKKDTTMLHLALKAGIPFIQVSSSDTLNLKVVLERIHEGPVSPVPDKVSQVLSLPGRVFYSTSPVQVTDSLYASFTKAGKSLVLVNCQQESPLMFDVGVLPTPRELIKEFLLEVVEPDKVDSMSSLFSGLTLKELGEVCSITMARDGTLSGKGVMATRAMLASRLSGLQMVDTDVPDGVYTPYPPLEEWLLLNESFFKNPPDPRLIPRGLLLNGPAGVGKSQAAKYLASKLEVPLYRLDLTAALGKYVGESEANFSKVLSMVDNENNAVLLIDEAEKLFQMQSDQGTTQRILSQLLWWLQERTSRILVVMTSNDINSIPPELYRGRRIDAVFDIPKLDLIEATALAVKVVKSFRQPTPAEVKIIKAQVAKVVKGQADARVSHALVSQIAIDLVKKHHWF